jgi:PHP family Zn ribbon phosphoesterase
MHLLVCPSCGRRHAVSGAGSLDGWRCGKCGHELAVVNRDVSRLALMDDVRPARGPRFPQLACVPLSLEGDSHNCSSRKAEAQTTASRDGGWARWGSRVA